MDDKSFSVLNDAFPTADKIREKMFLKLTKIEVETLDEILFSITQAAANKPNPLNYTTFTLPAKARRTLIVDFLRHKGFKVDVNVLYENMTDNYTYSLYIYWGVENVV